MYLNCCFSHLKCSGYPLNYKYWRIPVKFDVQNDIHNRAGVQVVKDSLKEITVWCLEPKCQSETPHCCSHSSVLNSLNSSLSLTGWWIACFWHYAIANCSFSYFKTWNKVVIYITASLNHKCTLKTWKRRGRHEIAAVISRVNMMGFCSFMVDRSRG